MMRRLLAKYLVPQHSDEEYRMAADYLSAREEIQKAENFEMIRNFRDWLKAELAQSKKMWVNFHRDYFAKWQILMIKVPCLLSWDENDKIKVTKKGKIKTTKIGYFFDCQKIV